MSFIFGVVVALAIIGGLVYLWQRNSGFFRSQVKDSAKHLADKMSKD